jgi:hypothetical protein
LFITGPILDAPILKIAKILQEFGMVQLSITAEFRHEGTWEIRTVRTTGYTQFVFGTQAHFAALAMKRYFPAGKTTVAHEVLEIHSHWSAGIPLEHLLALLFVARLIVNVHGAGSTISPAHSYQMFYIPHSFGFRLRVCDSFRIQTNKCPGNSNSSQSFAKHSTSRRFVAVADHDFPFELFHWAASLQLP